jgi:hypothetical protein
MKLPVEPRSDENAEKLTTDLSKQIPYLQYNKLLSFYDLCLYDIKQHI